MHNGSRPSLVAPQSADLNGLGKSGGVPMRRVVIVHDRAQQRSWGAFDCQSGSPLLRFQNPDQLERIAVGSDGKSSGQGPSSRRRAKLQGRLHYPQQHAHNARPLQQARRAILMAFKPSRSSNSSRIFVSISPRCCPRRSARSGLSSPRRLNSTADHRRHSARLHRQRTDHERCQAWQRPDHGQVGAACRKGLRAVGLQ